MIETDDPLLELDALVDEIAQALGQGVEVPGRLIGPRRRQLDLALLLDGLLRRNSPSLTARRISSHDASCINRVVRRMLSVA
ncbi:hypothetical protein AUC69_13990 [Methyloceanibacter superfactus]|uniref:Uncharacterized protein n=1 Tax=Methyloceanibacter superfactus TaxID=1774969 RepID=A0A1E3VT56_9HYPH|nr:hypothetical protein AUC69_13990 [Methyloceanibacter superfactus]